MWGVGKGMKEKACALERVMTSSPSPAPYSLLTAWPAPGSSLAETSLSSFPSWVLCGLAQLFAERCPSTLFHLWKALFFLSWLLHLSHHFLLVKSRLSHCFSGKPPPSPLLRFMWHMTFKVPSGWSSYKCLGGRNWVSSSLFPGEDITGTENKVSYEGRLEVWVQMQTPEQLIYSWASVFSFEKSKL